MALPLVISFFKTHTTFRLRPTLLRRRFTTATVSAATSPTPPSPSLSHHSSTPSLSSSSSSAHPKASPLNNSSLTFQQAIQRLQVSTISPYLFFFLPKKGRFFCPFLIKKNQSLMLLLFLQEYWASVGCSIMQCSNTEVINLLALPFIHSFIFLSIFISIFNCYYCLLGSMLCYSFFLNV